LGGGGVGVGSRGRGLCLSGRLDPISSPAIPRRAPSGCAARTTGDLLPSSAASHPAPSACEIEGLRCRARFAGTLSGRRCRRPSVSSERRRASEARGGDESVVRPTDGEGEGRRARLCSLCSRRGRGRPRAVSIGRPDRQGCAVAPQGYGPGPYDGQVCGHHRRASHRHRNPRRLPWRRKPPPSEQRALPLPRICRNGAVRVPARRSNTVIGSLARRGPHQPAVYAAPSPSAMLVSVPAAPLSLLAASALSTGPFKIDLWTDPSR